jgi:hypothetical protein
MPRPSHPPCFDHPNNTGRRVQALQLLIMQFSPTSCHFIPLRSKYSPKLILSNVCMISFPSSHTLYVGFLDELQAKILKKSGRPDMTFPSCICFIRLGKRTHKIETCVLWSAIEHVMFFWKVSLWSIALMILINSHLRAVFLPHV